MPYDISLTDRGLNIHLDGAPRYFNAYWLRDACTSCIDPQTRERIFDSSVLAEAPKAAKAWVEGDHLNIEWAAEDHISTVPLALLKDVAITATPMILPRCRARHGWVILSLH